MKKQFQYFVLASFLLIVAVALSGCVPKQENMESASEAPANNTTDTMEGTAEIKEGHLGCQENEIGIDGTCTVAEANNASLFDQKLDNLVITEEISKDGARGFLAKPVTEGTYPGVVMIHEWWGLNDNIREMAKILANEGYVVFAVDLYGEPAATESDQARELATRVRSNSEQAIADMKAVSKYLRENENISKLGAIGWCFGGQHSLLLSVNEWIDATVIYYGSLINDQMQLKNIRGPVLGIFGEKDTSIPLDSVRSFEANLDQLGIKNDIYVYDELGHAFANPSGSNYAPEQTKDAWQKTINFFSNNLK